MPGFARCRVVLWVIAVAWAAPGVAIAAEPREPFEHVGDVDGKLASGGGSYDGGTSFDHSGRRFVTLTLGGAVVWDTNTLKPLTERLRGTADGKDILALSGDGGTVMTVSVTDNTVRLYDVATSKVRGESTIKSLGTLDVAALSPDGSLVAVAGRGDRRAVFLWRPGEGGGLVEAWEYRPKSHLRSLRFDPAGRYVVGHFTADAYCFWSVDKKWALPVVDTEDWSIMNHVVGPPAFDPRGGQIALPQREGFTILDTDGWERRVMVNVRSAWSAHVPLRFSTDGSRLSGMLETGAGNDRTTRIHVHDADTGKQLHTFARGADDCALINGGKWAVVNFTAEDRTPHTELRDVATDAVLQSFPDRFQETSPDGDTILFDKGENSTRVWRRRAADDTETP